MPSTYAAQDAINLVKPFVHGVPLDDVKSNVCDMVNSVIWNYFPWGWTIRSLTPTNLNQQPQAAGSPPTGGAQFTGNQQDYPITGAWFTFPITLQANNTANNNYGGGWPILVSPNGLSESGNVVTVNLSYPCNLPIGTVLAGQVGTILGATIAGYNTSLTITNIPSNIQIIGTIATSSLAISGGSANPNILRPLKMRIGRIDTDPPEWRELKMLANLSIELSRTAGIETMGSCGWFASQNFFRLAYAPQVSQGNILQLAGEFQAYPTKITDEGMLSPLSFPDQYFDTFFEGVKWKIYELSDDPRAGTMQISANGSRTKQYTGQLGVFMEKLWTMARTEDLSAGDEFMSPESPLGVGRSYWPGVYGI